MIDERWETEVQVEELRARTHPILGQPAAMARIDAVLRSGVVEITMSFKASDQPKVGDRYLVTVTKKEQP